MSATPHQALYRRWRAQTFGQMVGQEPVVETLRNAVRADKVAHALLFVGPRGTGKTSMARIVAKALNCTDLRDGEPCDRCAACVSIREGRALDVIEMDAASNNRVDDMRELLARTMTAPSDLRRKVYIVDEVQRIKEGWDVLLKTLEEPPEQVAFIFCTTDAGGMRPAVLSRVQRFDFRRLTVPQIEGKLRMILDADGRSADPEAVELVARLASGGMRDAESMLDQLLSSGAERLTAGQVRALLGLADSEAVERFVLALLSGDALPGIAVLDDLEETGADLRSFLDQVVDHLRGELLAALRTGLGPGTDRSGAPGIAAARRLATIDAAQLGPGGLRFQLELALLASTAPHREVPSGVPVPPPATTPASRTDAAPQSAQRRAAGPPSGAPGRSPRATAGGGPAPAPAPTEEAAAASAEASPRSVAPTAPVGASPGSVAPTAPVDASPGTGAAIARRGAAAPVDAPPAIADASPAPAPVMPGPAGEPLLEELRRRWPDIVQDISRHPPTKPLIAVCRPIAVEGDTVVLGFPEEQSFLKDVAERRRTILEEGVSRHVGRAVVVRCVATNLDVVAPLTEDEAAARLLGEARRIFADDLVDVGEVG